MGNYKALELEMWREGVAFLNLVSKMSQPTNPGCALHPGNQFLH